MATRFHALQFDLMPALGFVAFMAMSSVSICPAQCEVKIMASDAQRLAHFGSSCAMDGDFLIAGLTNPIYGGSGGVLEPGELFVYRYDGIRWVEDQILSAGDLRLKTYFGATCAMSDDVIVVGAPRDDIRGNQDQGSAFVFRNNGSTWVKEQKLTASDGTPLSWFSRCATNGEVVVVSAPGTRVGSNENQGAAYLYRHDGATWLEEQKLTPVSGQPGQAFGEGCAISGDVVVVGAPGTDLQYTNEGAAHVYRYDGASWVEEQILTSGSPSNGRFGESCAIDGDVLAVGAPWEGDVFYPYQGAVYIFRHDGASWKREQRLVANRGGTSRDFFGEVCAIRDDTLVVGVPNLAPSGVGVVHVFRYAGGEWKRTAKLRAGDAAARDYFGRCVATNGDAVAAGSLAGIDDRYGAIYLYPGLSLGVDANRPPAGANISFETFMGRAGSDVLLVGMQINGMPSFYQLAWSSLGSDGRSVFSSTVPPGLTGTTVTFKALARGPCGKADLSNPVDVTFQ